MQTRSTDTVEISRKEYEEFLFIKEELAQLKRLIFGKKNERFIPADVAQTSLFEQPVVEEPATEWEAISYSREKKSNKKQPVRLALPTHLPREEEVIEPTDKHQDAVKIGEAITEILEYTPGKVYVKRYVRPKYVQPTEEGDPVDKKVVVASLPSLPIPSGNAGPSLLAHLMISKYVDHLPFYRQVQMFKRNGIKLSESTISGWFKAVCKLLEPLYDEIKNQVLASGYVHADETPIPVQSSNKPGATHTGYQWYYYSPSPKLVVVDYQKSRSREGPRAFLKGYNGVLQTDGYAGYEQFSSNPDITLLGCMAHARRYFEKALDNDQPSAEHVLAEIQKLYTIERKAKDEGLITNQITELRQAEARPILNSLYQWMQEQYGQVAPKSSIGKALAYCFKLWARLTRYTENGAWFIDNNGVENSIRPVALGRKNYLFAGSHDAAQWAAMMYSFLGTCKLNGVEPFQWLRSTLENIQETKLSQIHTLPPNFQQNS